MSKYENTLSFLSNMNITNEHLKTYGYRNRKPLKLCKYTAFVNCSGAGCTMLFNHSATQLYKQGVEDQMPYHDYQMLCVCLFMGKCYFVYVLLLRFWIWWQVA